MKIEVLAVRAYSENQHQKLSAHADVRVGDFIFKHLYVRKPGNGEQDVKWPRLRNPSGALGAMCTNPDLERAIKRHVLEAYLAAIREQPCKSNEVYIPFG